MLKRIFIEVLVILSVLLLCVIYGAVMTKDEFRPADTSPDIESAATEQAAALPSPEPEEPAPLKSAESAGVLQQAGEKLADQVSRFFLWTVGLVAAMLQTILQSIA